MFEYKVVRIDLGGVFNANPKEDYRKVIGEYTSQGWRFVQIFAPGVANNGLPKYYDVIFEKRLDENQY